MDYTEISVKTRSETSELVAYFLQEACLDGICIYDRNDLYDNPSWDYKDEKADSVYGSEVVVKGYCNVEDTDSVLDFLRKSFENLTDAGSLEVTVGTVDGDAWVEKWKETFVPVETAKLVVCPEWQKVETDKKVLLIDSGVAFGTGQHETTSMCLDLAQELDLTGKRVLDVGCGSGILGLCALLLGAEKAELVDIDSQATDVARHNAEINGLACRCDVKTGDLVEQTDGVFDVVFANLTADILAHLYEGISRVVGEKTQVILSGILDRMLDGVVALYKNKFDVLRVAEKGEWRALLLAVKEC